MNGRCAVTDEAELTGVPLFEIRTDVASAGVRICVVGGDAGMAEDARARLIELAGRWSATASGTVGDVRLRAGAVGTSARPAPGQRGVSQRAGVVAVTVVAATAWQAATIAQAAIRAGCPDGATLVGRAGGAGLFSFADGTHQSTARWPDFVA